MKNNLRQLHLMVPGRQLNSSHVMHRLVGFRASFTWMLEVILAS